MKPILYDPCYIEKTFINMDTSKIISLLGEQSEFLLGHTCQNDR